VAQFVEALRYKSEGCKIRFPVGSLGLVIDLILPALGRTPSLTEMRTRDILWEGTEGQCLGLTTVPRSCADTLEILGASTS
jgi:hypothetical protein